MSFEEDAKILHDHLELINRLNTAMAEALLKVAKDTATPPAELAQLVGMGGGGLHSLFHPLVMRHQEERQRRVMERQRRSQTAPERD
jgi:deferrochelatase/peroxidase EfeB